MQRRDFVRNSVLAGAGIWLHSLASCGSSKKAVGTHNFGIQLYTLRDDMPKDPRGVLQKLSAYGYGQLESFEHGQMGMFWGMTPAEFKTYVNGLGMQAVSSHCDIYKDFERKVDQAKEAGMTYLICPWLGPQTDMDFYRKAADKFNECGAVCKKAGLKFAYHNHDYSFKPVEGALPQDVMMQRTDAALVDYEMDMYWVVTAGQNPITWMEKYPNRFRLCHVKDRRKNAPATDTNASVTLGTGTIDYNTILKEAKAKGMTYFIVEQERYDGTTPMASAEANANFLKSLSI
jgi:sugar phosphate isomerase/epimerase